MTFKQMKVAFHLFWLAFKIRMMTPEKRELYLSMLRLNIDLNEDMTPIEKKEFRNYIDEIEKQCEE